MTKRAQNPQLKISETHFWGHFCHYDECTPVNIWNSFFWDTFAIVMTSEGHNQGRCHFTCPSWKLLEANVAAMNNIEYAWAEDSEEGLPVGTHLHMAVLIIPLIMMAVTLMFKYNLPCLFFLSKLIFNTVLFFLHFYACVFYVLKRQACFTGFIFHVPLVASSIFNAGHISTLPTVATSNYFIYILCNYHEIFLLWIRVPAKTVCYNIASSGSKFWWEYGGVAWWALVSTFLVTSLLRIITLECLLAELFTLPCLFGITVIVKLSLLSI